MIAPDAVEPAASGPKRRGKRFWFYVAAIPVIGVLGAMVVPQYMRAHTTACKNACVNNLRQIDGAKEQWALEKKKSEGTPVTTDDLTEINRFIKGGVAPTCPASGTYLYGAVGAAPKCSISVDGHSL
jgi:hypothetical protein